MKKYIEIGRDYVRKYYKGNLRAAVEARDGVMWDSVAKIQHGLDYFRQDGNEEHAMEALNRHMTNNRQFSHFVELPD